MSIDYGPLELLIGVWKGDRGVDIAPGPDGDHRSEFYETLQIKGVGELHNAGKQKIAAATYRQISRAKTDRRIIHEQTGYWTYESNTGIISQSVNVPRAVCILAGGKVNDSKESLALRVKANVEDPDWSIIQSPFMQANARCTAYENIVSVQGNILNYSQSLSIYIYDQICQHTDQNHLEKQTG